LSIIRRCDRGAPDLRRGAVADLSFLSQTTYSFRGDRLLLEPKEQVKSRLGYSPDDADAFVLTFAQPVAAGAPVPSGRRPGRAIVEYDPLAR
jgi:hypothetical protein